MLVTHPARRPGPIRAAGLVLLAPLVLLVCLALGPAPASATTGAPPAAAAHQVDVVAVSAPSPSPTPAVTPSGASGEVVTRDETGTGLVLPLLAGTVLALLVVGAVAASAILRRQSEERRL